MINLNNLYKFLLSRFIEKKEFKKSIWVQNYLKIRQNKYVNLYPNIASFAFDRIGANIFVYGIYEKEILIGMLYALISSIIGFILMTLVLSENNSIVINIKNAYQEGVIGKLISLGAILNLIVFYFFLNKKQDLRAKGVLFTTIILAILTLILKP